MQENLFIAALCERDRGLLNDMLAPVTLRSQDVVFDEGGAAASVYFPLDAVVSLVVSLSSGATVEAAMVGRDGMVGALAALDGHISMSRAIVQLGGRALVCDADAFRRAVMQSETLLTAIIRHGQTVFGQAQQSAACLAAHDIAARLARWLLRARDLSDSDTLPFTQNFLSEMLGTTRPSVSVVAHTLQQAGMIRYRRGKIEIVDVAALQETACECYGVVKDQYAALLRSAACTSGGEPPTRWG